MFLREDNMYKAMGCIATTTTTTTTTTTILSFCCGCFFLNCCAEGGVPYAIKDQLQFETKVQSTVILVGNSIVAHSLGADDPWMGQE
jgi:hypothetical protein